MLEKSWKHSHKMKKKAKQIKEDKNTHNKSKFTCFAVKIC